MSPDEEALSSPDVANELEKLGDPSGRQDSAYWNDWFDVVCRRQGQHRSFEWYCSADEVVRVVRFHITGAASCASTAAAAIATQASSVLCAMIHPGSGTSLVPLKLLEIYPYSRQVVVDISDVALNEMREFHTNTISSINEYNTTSEVSSNPPLIEYVVADLLAESSGDIYSTLLSTAAPNNDGIFDVWIDKGFVDAIFSKENVVENKTQSALLFQKAHRCLKSDTGCALIVSLAEDHSLQLILENWRQSNDTTGTDWFSNWQSTLHVWELEPISGDLPSFAFVLTKRCGGEGGGEHDDQHGELEIPATLIWHGRQAPTADCNATQLERHELALDGTLAMEQIQGRIEGARHQYRSDSRRQDRDVQAAQFKQNGERNVLTILEVKVYDCETDLVALSERLRSVDWQAMALASGGGGDGPSTHSLRQPAWQIMSEQSNTMHEIVPVGFGISKLLLQCIIPSSDIDELVELMQTFDEDLIQSVDVDRSNTIPLGNVLDVIQASKS
jgi:translation elongation factor EF-1beta